jgi:hypothetical protein
MNPPTVGNGRQRLAARFDVRLARDVAFAETLGRRLVAVARFDAVRFAVRFFAVRFAAVFLAAGFAFLATGFGPLAGRFADRATGRVRAFADFAGFRFRRGGDAVFDARTVAATAFGGATSSGGAGSVACQNGSGCRLRSCALDIAARPWRRRSRPRSSGERRPATLYRPGLTLF